MRPKVPAPDHRDQIAFAVLAAAVFLATAALSRGSGDLFRPYFGSLHPLVALAAATLFGGAALAWLRRRGWIRILPLDRDWRGGGWALLAATGFGVVVVAVDMAVGFPADINVPFPRSLLFYPTMAFVVEMVFHAAPLAVLLALLERLAGQVSRDRRFWWAIVLTACIEPAFQVVVGSSGDALLALELFVAVHVFLITVVELWLLKRYDFATMFAFRLLYYLYWHIAWGYVRLELIA